MGAAGSGAGDGPRAAFLTGLWVLAAVLAGPADAATKVSLQLRWDHQFQFAGYYAALWEGYYAEEGLDVEIRSRFAHDGRLLDAIEEVAEGRADFGIGAADILIARNHGAPLVVVTSVFQQSGVGFFAPLGLTLDKPSDLYGLRIGRRLGDLVDVEFLAMLRAEGIDPEDLQTVALRTGLDDVLAGRVKVDVFPGYTITTPYRARRAGLALRVLRPASYGIDFYGDSLFTTESLVAGDPDLVERFERASLRGWQHALEHPERMARQISERLRRVVSLDDPVDFHHNQASEVRELVENPLVEIGHTNPRRWARMHNVLRDLGLVQGGLGDARLVFDPAAASVERQQRVRFRVLVGIGGLLAVLLATAGWTWALRRRVGEVTHSLREREELLALLIEHAPAAVAMLDRDLRYLAASRRWLEDYSLEGQALGGRHHYEVFPNLPQRLKDVMNRCLAGAVEQAPAERMRRPSGEIDWIRWEVRPWRRRAGEVGGVVVFTEIITESREAMRRLEEAVQERAGELLESERRFRALFEHAPIGIAQIGTEGRWRRVNRRVCGITGYPESELLELAAQDVIHSDDRAASIEQVRQVLAGEQAVSSVESRYVRKDGEVVWVNLSVSSVHDDAGRPAYLVAMIEDISERKRIEGELVHAKEEAESASRAKSDFLASVSHELRTPLNAIIGYSEMLLEEGGQEEAEWRGDVHNIRSAGGHLLALINDILDLSRVEARKMDLSVRSFEVDAMVAEVADTSESLVRGNDNEMQVRCASDVGEMRTDERKVRQILFNLLSNAAKFTRGGRVSLEAVREGAEIVFRVSDTGAGIDAADLGRIFEPFDRGAGRAAGLAGGTGLGLALTRAFCHLLGGDVEVCSVPGDGSTFTVRLPAVLQEAAEVAGGRDGP